MVCPVCGQDGCMETTISGFVTKRKPGQLPRRPVQKQTLGVAGYSKPVRLYDPNNPHVVFVQAEDDEPAEEKEEEEVKRRVRTIEDGNA